MGKRIDKDKAIPNNAFILTGTTVGIPGSLPLRGLVQVWQPAGRSKTWTVEWKAWYAPRWMPSRRFVDEGSARRFVAELTGGVPGAWVIETY